MFSSIFINYLQRHLAPAGATRSTHSSMYFVTWISRIHQACFIPLAILHIKRSLHLNPSMRWPRGRR